MGHTCVKKKSPSKPKMKVTSYHLRLALLEYYRFKRSMIAVDEYNGADIIVDTGKDIIEVEIKVTRSDLRREQTHKQGKHLSYRAGQQWARCHPNRFMFCVPLKMREAAEAMIAELNPKYGLITFDSERFLRAVVEGYGQAPSHFLLNIKRAGKLHTNYSKRQQELIARRCSAKLITLLQNQHVEALKSECLRMQS